MVEFRPIEQQATSSVNFRPLPNQIPQPEQERFGFGDFVREVAQPFARLGANVAGIADIVRGKSVEEAKRERDFGFFGTVSPVGQAGTPTQRIKDIAGTALEVSSTVVPVGKAPTVARTFASSILRGIGTGAATGFTSGLAFGAGRELQNPNSGVGSVISEGVENSIYGTLFGGAFGGVTSTLLGTPRLARSLRTSSAQNTVKKRVDALTNLQNNNGPLNRTITAADKAGVDTKQFLAESDLLVGAVDNTGTINTKNAVSKLDDLLRPWEDRVSRLLDQEGKFIDLQSLQSKIKAVVDESKLVGGLKQQALRRAAQELNALAREAVDGQVPLRLVHDLKVQTNRTNAKSFIDPEKNAVGKTVGRALKEFVEEQTEALDVKNFNAELRKLYAVRNVLERLNNKKVEGGRLGKYFAQTIGGVAGAQVGGGIGAIIGAEAGGFIRGAQLQRSLGGAAGRPVKISPAMRAALQSLKKEGPRTINQTTINNTTKNVINPVNTTAPTKATLSAGKETQKRVLDELSLEISFLQDAVDDNPAKALQRYAAGSSNTLSEIQHRNQGTNRKSAKLDDIVTELGFTDLEDAETALREYRSNKARLEALKKRRKELRQEIRNGEDVLVYDDPSYYAPTEMFGAVGGISVDENGNLTFDEEAALLSMAGIAGVTRTNVYKQLSTKLDELTKDELARFVTVVKGGGVKTSKDGNLIFSAVDDMNESSAKAAFEDGLRFLDFDQDTMKFANESPGAIANFYEKILSQQGSDLPFNQSATTKTTDYAYHATSPKNLESIKKNGLKPGGYGNLYFAPTEAGISGYGGNVPLKLRINRSNLPDDFIEAYGERGASPLGEIKTKKPVPPEAIEIFENGKWKPLVQNKTTDLLTEARKYKSADEFVRAQGVTVFHGGKKQFQTADELNVENGFYTLKRTDDDIADQANYIGKESNRRITKIDRIKSEKLLSPNEIKELEAIPTWEKTAKQQKRFKELTNKAWEQSRKKEGITDETELAAFNRDPATAFGNEVTEFVVNFKNPMVVDFNGKGWREGGSLYDTTTELIAEAKKAGHDGIIINNISEGFTFGGAREAGLVDDYIVVDKNAIKTRAQLEDIWKQANANQPNATR